jgi:hypothetical protein
MRHFLENSQNMPINSNKSEHYRKLAQTAWHNWTHLLFRETCAKVSPHSAPLNFLSLFCTLYPKRYEFFRANRWSIGTINYQLQHKVILSSITKLKNKDRQKNTQCEII